MGTFYTFFFANILHGRDDETRWDLLYFRLHHKFVKQTQWLYFRWFQMHVQSSKKDFSQISLLCYRLPNYNKWNIKSQLWRQCIWSRKNACMKYLILKSTWNLAVNGTIQFLRKCDINSFYSIIFYIIDLICCLSRCIWFLLSIYLC